MPQSKYINVLSIELTDSGIYWPLIKTDYIHWQKDNYIMLLVSIHTPMTTIMRLSVSDTNPSGTLLFPPTHAHFNSLLSIYTAFTAETAPMLPMNSATGDDIQTKAPETIKIPCWVRILILNENPFISKIYCRR